MIVPPLPLPRRASLDDHSVAGHLFHRSTIIELRNILIDHRILWIDRRKASRCIHGELSSMMAEPKSKQRKREREREREREKERKRQREREREINKGERKRERKSVFGSI